MKSVQGVPINTPYLSTRTEMAYRAKKFRRNLGRGYVSRDSQRGRAPVKLAALTLHPTSSTLLPTPYALSASAEGAGGSLAPIT